MKMYYKILSFIIIISSFSCANDVIEKLESVPNSFGKANEIVVLSDDNIWEGNVGDSLKFYYSAAFPITPTPEPIYDLRQYTPEKIQKTKVLGQYRSYLVLANLGDENSSTTKMVIQDIGEEKYRKALSDKNFRSIVGKNKWAKNQVIIYLFAPTESELIDVVKAKFPDVSNRIYDHDYSQIKANAYNGGVSNSLSNDVNKLYKISMEIPVGWQELKLIPEEETIWFGRADAKAYQNLAIMKYPYSKEGQLDKSQLIERIEAFGAKHIDGDQLVLNDQDLPIYEFDRSRKGMYIKELRGIWEMKNSFKGGPFIARAIQEENSDQIILMFAFIYAPGEKKRNYLQQLEVILGTAKSINLN